MRSRLPPLFSRSRQRAHSACPSSSAHQVGIDLAKRMPSEAMSLESVMRSCPSFSKHVPIVIGNCANEQMGGVDTRWVIAEVADNRAARDLFFSSQFPCDTMRTPRIASAIGEVTVSAGVATRPPQPTFGLCPDRYFFPESVCKWSGSWCHVSHSSWELS